jgi:hypothetical protein
MQDPKNLKFPPLIETHDFEDTQPTSWGEFEETRPIPLFELPKELQIEHNLNIVRAYHARIADAIEMFWGHRDCNEYLQKLICNGGDGFGNARIGFKREVLAALINLSALHEVKPLPFY